MGFIHLFSFLTILSLTLFIPVCGNAELKALMDIKSALDPQNQFLSSWTTDGNPCSGSFEGISCNQYGKVANISLQAKGLSGSVPPAISGLKCLSALYLHFNSLTGQIPREISNLTELTDLYLSFNNLSGTIPPEISHMASLQVLQLCYNNLNGGIPTQIGSLKKLSVLALQHNGLNGAIPASLGDLGMLERVDLSSNKLFGSIPGKLSRVPNLKVLDVRNNTLSGYVPPALKRLTEGFLYEGNSGLCGTGFSSLRVCTSSDQLKPNRPEPYGPEATGFAPKEIPESANIGTHCNKTHCSNSSNSPKVAVVGGIIAFLVGGTVAGLLAFTMYRRRKQRIGSAFELSDSRLSTDQAKDLCRKSSSPLVSLEYSNGWDPLAVGRSGIGFSQAILQSFRFNLEEVESATQYFSAVNLLGKSNFSAVYRGILRDGSVVAVKSINNTSCKLEEVEFLKGLQILTSLRHENLIRLRGFCCSRDRGECFLIYDFVSNGSLLQYLDVSIEKDRVLDWSTRVSIINGIAKGIEYLHSNKLNKAALVHQSLSAEKVLIDQHCNPLLSDSGLHKLLADDVVFSTLKASAAMGYLAPEYTTTGRFTEKSDVYSFGVILFQILSGKRRITHSIRLGAESGIFEDIIDENLHGKFSESEALKLAKIALICTNESPNLRPTMEVVIQELSKCSISC
ncbi:proline-rich receptor-like protein kinase PERK9 [Tasmannia lanceolata]|uniref:proline-rich receptor-like protein kinase PERK9 n=1 Tax=Tasmannia lanceolata TaxID=3420 RepID=UPI004063647F